MRTLRTENPSRQSRGAGKRILATGGRNGRVPDPWNYRPPTVPAGDFRATLRDRWAHPVPTVRKENTMPHMIRPVAKKTKDTGFTPVPVPDDVAKELAELADYLAAHPAELAVAEFDSASELDEFVKQARTWARQNGLEFRRSAWKDAPDNHMRFNIRPPLTDEQKAANKRANEKATSK